MAPLWGEWEGEPWWPGSPSPGQCLCPTPFTSVLVGKLSTGGGGGGEDQPTCPGSQSGHGASVPQSGLWPAGVPRIMRSGG